MNIQGLLSLLGFTSKKGPDSKTVGMTVGAVVAAAAIGYGIYQARNSMPQSTTATVATQTGAAGLDKDFVAQVANPRGDRVVYWSGQILKNKLTLAKLNKLASGAEVQDNAPLVPNQFDCTTFVETVAALSQSGRSADFVNKLTSIRYHGGGTTFAHRNHFPEADWIPNNSRAGNLTDITAQVASSAGVTAQTESKEIQRHAWLAALEKGKKLSRKIASATEKEWSATTPAQVQYIPLADLNKVADKIPSGTVINFVHKNDAKKPVLISHQGFVIHEGGKTYLRHSSSGGEVRQLILADYLAKLSKGQEKKSSWPLIGFNLNQIN